MTIGKDIIKSRRGMVRGTRGISISEIQTNWDNKNLNRKVVLIRAGIDKPFLAKFRWNELSTYTQHKIIQFLQEEY